jgi:hypothetical protein
MTVNGRKTGLILCAWLLLPGLAAAQDARAAPERAPAQRTQMSEDIEVLRRLLNSKLQARYAPATQLAEAWRWTNCASCHSDVHKWPAQYLKRQINHPNASFNSLQPYQPLYISSDNYLWSTPVLQENDPGLDRNMWVFWDAGNSYTLHPSTHALVADPAFTHPNRPLDTEGVYLKGQGVIYTLTLPLPPKPKSGAAKADPKPVSDWDRVRRELRNEKPEPEPKERPHTEPSLAEILLQVLAENGHHFGQLGENESLTVVVTFRGENQAEAKAANPPPAENAPAAQKPAASSQVGNPGQDYELLGDLHMKQGKLAEAERAYRQAIAECKSAQRTVALWGKCAQALLGEGKMAEAQQVLEQALKDKKQEQAKPPQPSQPRDANAAVLPAKLIVTASKKLLDQAAGGKMSLDEFQKAATVEYVNLAPPPD